MFRGQRYDIFRILQGFWRKIIVYWLASEDFAYFESRRGDSPRTPYHSFSFWSAIKKTESKERARKRPELRGRNTNSPNHSMNSLRSNSISYFVAQIANTIRDSMLIQRICITLKTSSCGMFSLSCASMPGDRYLPSAFCQGTGTWQKCNYAQLVAIMALAFGDSQY